jgi:hypothetical protein
MYSLVIVGIQDQDTQMNHKTNLVSTNNKLSNHTSYSSFVLSLCMTVLVQLLDSQMQIMHNISTEDWMWKKLLFAAAFLL